jgi:hypothetical protein
VFGARVVLARVPALGSVVAVGIVVVAVVGVGSDVDASDEQPMRPRVPTAATASPRAIHRVAGRR